ncbi:MAG: hypothetical protein ABSF98_03640 [Bryobacteraceae bacterium]
MIQLLVAFSILRELAGHMKPVKFAHTPPGAIANYVFLPLATLMLVPSTWKRGSAGADRAPSAAG